MKPHTILALGRAGDVVNVLPIAKHLSRSASVRFVVAKEFASVLEGASYVKPLVWKGRYDQLKECLHWLLRLGIHKPIVAQSYMNPDADRSHSYQKDAWRLAGYLKHWGTLPLLFDKRDPVREWKLLESMPVGKPWVLVCSKGVSSPIPALDNLVPALKEQFPECEIIDLSEIRAHRVYDLLALMDFATLLISVDTVFLHLANASRCPVISIVNDMEPWRASVRPMASVAQLGYKNVSTGDVVQATGAFLANLGRKRRVYHAACMFGTQERHIKAYKSWKKLKERGMIGVYRDSYPRYFEDNGRKLPFLRDILEPALERMAPEDVLLWGNSDVQLRPETLDWAKHHVGIYGAATIRRDKGHQGRDAFCFTKQWLMDNPLPDWVIGAPQFDIHCAAIIREQRGIRSTLENISMDFYPCEPSDSLIIHEDHEESWQENSPAATHNASLFNYFLQAKQLRFW